MKRVYLSVINDLSTDQRVHKVAMTLKNLGFEPVMVGRKLRNSLPLKNRDYQTIRLNLLFAKGPFFYAEYNIRLFFFFLFKHIDCLLANDLDVLPANYLVSKIRRIPLVYDSHELFTEVPELIKRQTIRKIWLKIEKIILPKIKYSYTVCHSIANAYEKRYGIMMKVVRNVPYLHGGMGGHVPEIVVEYRQKGFKILIYQGALNLGRGIEYIVSAMQFLDNYVLLLVGDGDIKSKLTGLTRELHLEGKVKFIGRIPFEDLYDYTAHSDLGICLLDDMGLNYRYALPNRLFDYIQAKLPILCTDFPEMKKIVDEYQIGILTDTLNPEVLARTITEMMNNLEQYQIWKQNLSKAAIELCWEREEEILKAVFDELT